MMNKKAVGSITGVFLSILVTLALFYAGYNYINNNYEQAGVTDELGYNQSYADLQTSQDNLDDNIGDIQEAARGIAEANSNVFLVAWNGLTGLAYTIRFFFDIIPLTLNVFEAIIPALAFLPTWVESLITMGIIITIILLIIGAFKGETKT